jgi:hypothetical protein
MPTPYAPVGFLLNGSFLCPDCAVKTSTVPHLVPVYRVNIGIYSQACSACKRLLVDGVKRRDGSPLNLFERGV